MVVWIINALKEIEIECTTTGNKIAISYIKDNFISILKARIKSEAVCNYEGPQLIIEPKTITQNQITLLNSYNNYIPNAVSRAQNVYGNNVPISLVKAIIMQESQVDETAKSSCGAIGLMQLIRGTAIEMGLKVPEYGTSKEQNCKDNKGQSLEVSNCRRELPQNCRPNEDERLNPEKNILAGTLYIAKQLGYFDGNLELALAAYNWGPGNVENNCPKPYATTILSSCRNVREETENYVPSVLGYKQYLDNLGTAWSIN